MFGYTVGEIQKNLEKSNALVKKEDALRNNPVLLFEEELGVDYLDRDDVIISIVGD